MEAYMLLNSYVKKELNNYFTAKVNGKEPKHRWVIDDKSFDDEIIVSDSYYAIAIDKNNFYFTTDETMISHVDFRGIVPETDYDITVCPTNDIRILADRRTKLRRFEIYKGDQKLENRWFQDKYYSQFEYGCNFSGREKPFSPIKVTDKTTGKFAGLLLPFRLRKSENVKNYTW